MTEVPIPVVGRNLRGRPLRRVLAAQLAASSGPMTVTELVAGCEAIGVFWGDERPSKVVSDALRAEMYWGRVHRVGRGRYAFSGAPRTTLDRINRQAGQVASALATAHRLVRRAAADPAWQWELRDQLNIHPPNPRAVDGDV